MPYADLYYKEEELGSENDENKMSLICDYLLNEMTQPSFAVLLLEL